jgi:ribosomal protein S18 acetylase RimI-like enzyme
VRLTMKREISYRRLRLKHATAVSQLGIDQNEFHCNDLGDAWQKDEIRRWLGSRKDVCIGAFDSGEQIVGYCLTHLHRSVNKVYLENIYVAPSCRRHGVGSGLLAAVKSTYSKNGGNRGLRYVGLVLETNSGAIRFFRHAGFDVGEKLRWLQM